MSPDWIFIDEASEYNKVLEEMKSRRSYMRRFPCRIKALNKLKELRQARRRDGLGRLIEMRKKIKSLYVFPRFS